MKLAHNSQFSSAINVINVYGEIEYRSSKNEVEARWNRIRENIKKIVARNEWVLLIGDLNKAIGNKENGVEGNHEKVSFVGRLVHKLLETEEYILVNNTKNA